MNQGPADQRENEQGKWNRGGYTVDEIERSIGGEEALVVQPSVKSLAPAFDPERDQSDGGNEHEPVVGILPRGGRPAHARHVPGHGEQ